MASFILRPTVSAIHIFNDTIISRSEEFERQRYSNMSDMIISEVIPIYTDPDGRMRVTGTRVLLDLIVEAYGRGETPEHIVQMYPTLKLDQVFLALGYYMRHRADVDTYIRRMDDQAEDLRQKWETEYPPNVTRAELQKRLQAKRNVSE
jgi:uncharacterized protein (DUF433 family)